MAFNGFQLLPCIFLALIVLSFTSHAHRNPYPKNKINERSPFEFIGRLTGYHKGNTTKEILQLKNYLQRFGYLDNPSYSNNEAFDDALEAAVKRYQNNYHLKPTGTLDTETVSQMMTPRCGVADIVKGINFMQAENKMHDSNSSVSHYSSFPGNPRWPKTKTHLTYTFLPGTPWAYKAPVDRAFNQWDVTTRFSFSRAWSVQTADLVIGFYQRDHGDGFSFDGPGGILAHAFAPTNGRFHYDADEKWSIGPVPNAYDLQTVALHEIGHLLGLGHSSVREAIMFPTIAAGRTKRLSFDDLLGIRALYYA